MRKPSCLGAGILATVLLIMSAEARAAEASRAPFGRLSDGTPIEIVTLANKSGVTARVMTLGATLQSIESPGRDGKPDDIVLGYDTAAEYLDQPQYFGSTVGRYANRIAGGRFELDGRTYQLETNDGPNHLHGGVRGIDKRVWKIDAVSSGPQARAVLSYVSPDGEGGYPGELKITATFTLNEANELGIEYRATTNKPTIVNITNHNFYNLAGARTATDVYDQMLTIPAKTFTPVDATLIPTGELRQVAGTAFDFTTPRAIGARIRDGDQQIRIGRGYDHNFVVDGAAGTMRLAARMEDPLSGRVMEILSTAPGLQFYSGNFLDGRVVGKAGRVYRQGEAICLEPQAFPDGPNRPAFPSSRLDPGQTYVNRMILRFPNPA